MRFVKPLVAATLALSLCAASAMAEVVAVVSTRSSLTTLTKNQVTDIFLGKTSRFPDGSQAIPIDQVEGSAARDEFYAAVAGKSAAQIKAYWSKIIFTCRGSPPREMQNNSEVKKFLGENLAAIGYIDKSELDSSVKVLKISP
ncbi:MAG: phosphate ABC transporter substrate-binding protein [Georgfuchsia sp.]